MAAVPRSGPAVRTVGLAKRFGANAALDGVDLQVDAGELRGLLGPNGAGKTTLLRLLFGLVRPDTGSIELLGQPLTATDPAPLGQVGGFVEDPAFYPFLSGRENLELLAELDGRREHELIDEALARVDLVRCEGQRVSGYSTGMRQRLGIAAALLRRPRLLLLDEPTSGLDPAGTRAVTELVRSLSQQGVAVLLSSHQIGELEKLCDAYTVLREGRVVWDGSAAELAAQAPAGAYSLTTTDDERALSVSQALPGIRIERAGDGGLEVAASETDLDACVLALGRAGIAVRRLDLRLSPLESMFFALTGEAPSEQLT